MVAIVVVLNKQLAHVLQLMTRDWESLAEHLDQLAEFRDTQFSVVVLIKLGEIVHDVTPNVSIDR